MPTIAEIYEARGQSNTLLRLLERRFGPLTEAVQSRVRAASSEDREAWAIALLDAESLDAVFAHGAGS